MSGQYDALLEIIRTNAGLNYVSDLHEQRYYKRVLEAVREISGDEFDSEEWAAVSAYIFRENVPAFAAEDVVKLLEERTKTI